MMAEKYYSPEEMAEQFNLKPATVRKWIRQGQLKAIKLGGLWRISEEELQRFVKAGQGESD
jgi:excisionase family DNA binding protein